MKFNKSGILMTFFALLVCFFFTSSSYTANPIMIGDPLSTFYLYVLDAERGIKLAVVEINAKSGVNVGEEKRLFKVEVIDTRGIEPSVPVSEALMAVERLILNK